GAAIIIGANVYIAHRETVLARRAASPGPSRSAA
ncbi:EamA family transporter, partial [Xanthomonas citri pv. citri]